MCSPLWVRYCATLYKLPLLLLLSIAVALSDWSIAHPDCPLHCLIDGDDIWLDDLVSMMPIQTMCLDDARLDDAHFDDARLDIDSINERCCVCVCVCVCLFDPEPDGN